MESGRPLRIARRSRPVVRIPRSTRAGLATEYRANQAGTQRASRLFTLHVGALVVLYGILLALLARAPGGVASNAGLLAALAVVALVLAFVGWQVTLGQTPRGVWAGSSALVVRERLGRHREFPTPTEGGLVIARRFPSGWLSSEPTLIVRIKDASGLPRVYLVGEGVLPSVSARPP